MLFHHSSTAARRVRQTSAYVVHFLVSIAWSRSSTPITPQFHQATCQIFSGRFCSHLRHDYLFILSYAVHWLVHSNISTAHPVSRSYSVMHAPSFPLHQWSYALLYGWEVSAGPAIWPNPHGMPHLPWWQPAFPAGASLPACGRTSAPLVGQTPSGPT